jgi:inner membrane protein
MFIFGHVGITLAATALVGSIVVQCREAAKRKSVSRTSDVKNYRPSKQSTWLERSGLDRVAALFDVRLLIIGSLFPDIIDKPLSFMGFGTGRSITHTLIVFLFILFTSLFVYLNYRKAFLIPIAIGVFTHLVLDSMWQAPQTLFWPLLGALPQPTKHIWLDQFSEWWHTLVTNPGTDVSEGIGLLVILIFIAFLLKRNNLKSFLWKARI